MIAAQRLACRTAAVRVPGLALQASRPFASSAPALKKVLVAVDNTEGAENAFNAAVELARPEDTMILFTCGPSVQKEALQYYSGADWMDKEEQNQFIQQLGQKSDAQARGVQEKYEEKCEESGVSHEWVCGDAEEGPRSGIVDACDKHKVDLTVLGSHGTYGTVRRFLLGSTADYVAHNASCDVLLVKHPHHAAHV